jgi:predicted histidine transporter YuiF (NhaC family)
MLEWVVLIAVLSLVVFSLLRVHVLLALILSGIIAGLASGLSFIALRREDTFLKCVSTRWVMNRLF